MAQILERPALDGKTHYLVRVRLKGSPPECATFTRKTDATKWAAQTESAIREGRYFKSAEAKRHTLGDAIDRYIKEVLPRKPKSAVKQQGQLEWWKAAIGHYTLANVTPARIAEQRSALLEGKGTKPGKRKEGGDAAPARPKDPATANRYMAILSHLFTVCVKEWGWLDDTPIRKIPRLKESRGRVRYLSKEKELPELLKACAASTDPNLYDAVVLALSTGCRKNEILCLRWADVDFERGQIVLRDTKNGESRAVPLAGHAFERIKERGRIRRIDCDYVFPCPSKPVPADVDRPFVRAREKAKLEDFRFHDLRHSAASYLAMNGATLSEIAEVLGHKTLAMVKRYAHLSQAHTSRVVASMNAAMFEGVKADAKGDR